MINNFAGALPDGLRRAVELVHPGRAVELVHPGRAVELVHPGVHGHTAGWAEAG